MPSRRAVFLKPPESVCPPRASRGPGGGIPDATTGRFSPISFPCHTFEESSANSNHCHTSKTASRKPFACHTSETPRGVRCPSFRLVAFLPRHLSAATRFQFFLFKRCRTLSQKHPGWGEAHDCTSHSETPSGAPEPLVTRRISCSKILRHPVPVYGNSLSLQSLSRSARFFPANLRRQGLSRL